MMAGSIDSMDNLVQPARILIVDDDVGLVTLIAECLRDHGHKIATAASGTEALAGVEQHPPDLMLLDLKMKDLSGQAVLRRLKKQDTPVPFIVITGQGDERVAVELMKEGALDYVVKDTTLLEVLPARVRHALDQVHRDRALAVAQAELQQSQRKILAIVDHEQRRIGQDLHDSLGQQLTAIEFQLHSLFEDLNAPDLAGERVSLIKQAKEVGRTLRETITFTRSLARGLAPVKFESQGLMEALEELARRTDTLGRTRCRFECPAPVLLADAEVASHLFRIAQESVSNALKYAQAHEIVIKLNRKRGGLTLSIRDNGQGLPPTATVSSGMGLSVMKHRANVLGASLDIQSASGKGVTVTCNLPLD